nr:ABC transporter ATP-binding protein [Salinarimonas soli]
MSVEALTLEVNGHRLTDEVSFEIRAGEMLALVGESGCGKSVTALSILRIHPDPPISLSGGRIVFDGRDLAALSADEMRAVRGDDIAMIFQEPMTSLNPVLTVGDQIAEALILHRGMSRRAALARAGELIELVGLPNGRRQVDRYPHQLSGGQRQRIMIAMALACEPKLLIADEPTTALDVTVQAQILALIDTLRRDAGMACLLITHDLGVVAEVCDRAAVMYAGKIVETGPVDVLLGAPRHRYTRALVDTIPAMNPPGQRLPSIAGTVPPPGSRAPGCPFVDRCDAPTSQCRTLMPPPEEQSGHIVRCWNPAQ